MPLSAAAFLDLLEQRGIMAPDHVDHLREQLARSGVGIHPVHIARKLVEAGYLNPYFAKTLLEEGSARSRVAASRVRSAEDEIDLAPLEEERGARAGLEPVAVEFDIDLPPIRDPDEWIRAGETLARLPAVEAAGGVRSLKEMQELRKRHTRRQSLGRWLPWAIAAAAVVAMVLLLAALYLFGSL